MMRVKATMGKAELDKGSRHQQRIAMQMNGLKGPGNLQEMVWNGTHLMRKVEEIMSHYDEEEDDIELSLGLSTNGRFGVDPKRAKMLTRSSSIPTFMMINNNGGDGEGSCGAAARLAPFAAGSGGRRRRACVPLTRTCSLPTEAEEEWRRRKELQSLRRMEAKRRRLEKLKNGKVGRDKADFEDNCEDSGPGSVSNVNEMSLASFHAGSCLSAGAAAGDNASEGLVPSQCSIASQGSGSSGVSDFESQPTQGTKRLQEVKSPACIQSRPEHIEQKQAFASSIIRDSGHSFARIALQNPSMKVAVADRAKETGRNVMLDMPCVSARGDGPNGKRIEGFLYRYGKGEELKIVCVCHGSFLSPAEFVKHAGGGDVAYPLKHIVVYPPPVL